MYQVSVIKLSTRSSSFENLHVLTGDTQDLGAVLLGVPPIPGLLIDHLGERYRVHEVVAFPVSKTSTAPVAIVHVVDLGASPVRAG